MTELGVDEAVGALGDDRLTLFGLLHETMAGLADLLEARMRTDADLAPPWFEVLLRLARSPGRRLRMSELADQTTLTRSGLTRVVDRLVDEGLVGRAACESDRRGAFAQLTPAGLARLEDALPGHLELLEQHLVGALTDAELRQLEQVLRKLRAGVHPGGDPDRG